MLPRLEARRPDRLGSDRGDHDRVKASNEMARASTTTTSDFEDEDTTSCVRYLSCQAVWFRYAGSLSGFWFNGMYFSNTHELR
jgi:hypothetical protein